MLILLGHCSHSIADVRALRWQVLAHILLIPYLTTLLGDCVAKSGSSENLVPLTARYHRGSVCRASYELSRKPKGQQWTCRRVGGKGG